MDDLDLIEMEATDTILRTLKGHNVDDALKMLDECKKTILSQSIVSYAWDRCNYGE